MSEKSKKIIKYFCDRFLEIDYYPTKISAILDLSISKLRNIKEESNLETLLKKENIEIIRDLSEISSEQIKELMSINDIEIDKKIIYNSIIAANLVSNAWQKRKLYEERSKLKVVMAGLDFAGKTSLINRLVSNKPFLKMINPEPTQGHNVEEYETAEFDLVMWDLGGQKAHIEEYLEEPEKYFVQLDILIFVIDAQDDLRYEEALNYLHDIINVLDFLDERPYILVMLNKSDSDIYNDPEFQIKLEYIVDKIEQMFLNLENKWNFEIIPTSIYNLYSFEPNIVKNIKNIFSVSQDSEKKSVMIEKIEEREAQIDEKLERILDINFKYMEQILEEITMMRRTFNRITPMNIASEYLNVPFILSEEKDFSEEKQENKQKKKGKQKKRQGPPKRMQDKSEKITEETTKANLLQEARKNLVSVDSKITSHPPMAPPHSKGEISIRKSELRPPPKNPASASHNFRKDIISELKEIFVKKGIAKNR